MKGTKTFKDLTPDEQWAVIDGLKLVWEHVGMEIEAQAEQEGVEVTAEDIQAVLMDYSFLMQDYRPEALKLWETVAPGSQLEVTLSVAKKYAP